MTPRLKSHPSRFTLLLALPLALGILAFGGCSDDDENPPSGGGTPPTTTSFKGVFANSTENGSLSVTVQSTSLASPHPGRLLLATRPQRSGAAVVSATGTLKPIGGSQASVSGSYDPDQDTLYLAGAGYTMQGQYDSSGTFQSISGMYSGPNGQGFFGCVTGSTTPATYCGTFTGGSTGNWDILIAGDKVGGIAFPATGEPSAFEGTIETTGTMRAITAGNSDPGVSTLTVTGTWNTTTNTVSGSWTFEDLVTPSTISGTWSGSPCP
jgi:hypothetical protein